MELVNNEMPDNCRCRILSGSVLDGLEIGQTGGFLGRYHNQISIIPDSINTKKFNWFAPLIKLYRANGIFSSAQDKKDFNTACNGRSSAMIPVEAFDRIMPLDILLSPLLRAILVKDTVTAQNLGCLELVEEDLALSSFICPAKQDYGIVLRKNLNQIEMDG
jgi:Na+-transporting NADH:ubiquinone oxidoreductase subunit A